MFLFDEPLSNLDASLRVQMRIEIGKLHQDLKATMIYVTHDQVEAMTMADKIVVLNAGLIEQVGSPLELYHRPRNMFVAGFIGSPKMNFIKATAPRLRGQHNRGHSARGGKIKLPSQGAKVGAGQSVTLGIRPEHLVVTEKADAALAGDGAAGGISRAPNRCSMRPLPTAATSRSRPEASPRRSPGQRLLLAFPPRPAISSMQTARRSSTGI